MYKVSCSVDHRVSRVSKNSLVSVCENFRLLDQVTCMRWSRDVPSPRPGESLNGRAWYARPAEAPEIQADQFWRRDRLCSQRNEFLFFYFFLYFFFFQEKYICGRPHEMLAGLRPHQPSKLRMTLNREMHAAVAWPGSTMRIVIVIVLRRSRKDAKVVSCKV